MHASGDIVEGEWSAGGALTDVLFRYATGGQYDGDLDHNLRPHGDGTRAYPSGAKYSGAFVCGMREGNGICREANGDEYDGSWFDDARHGRGTLRFADGGTYEGGFVAGVREGHGLMRHADGTMYEGEWLADKYEGVGNLYYAADDRGSDMYGGHWRGGLPEGHGVYSYASGGQLSSAPRTVVHGECGAVSGAI